MAQFSPGTILFGKYRIERLVGKGGFAEVYLATHLHLEAPRALKILTKGGPVTTGAVHKIAQRFRLEAQLGARFAREPHIVRVYDFEWDQEQDLLALVTEYMPGGSLRERLRAAREQGLPGLAVDFVVRTAYHVALGLAVLHGAELVHRDIKPSNILYDAQGQAKIADLGVVQMPHGLTRRTELGDTAPRHPGTPEYMSPEQEITVGYLRPASDIYSLGVTLFEALTLRKYKQLRPGTRVSQFRADVPSWLDDLIYHMLAEDPQARPWDGNELADQIRHHQGSPTTVLSPTRTEFSQEYSGDATKTDFSMQENPPFSVDIPPKSQGTASASRPARGPSSTAAEPTQQPTTTPPQQRPGWLRGWLLGLPLALICSLSALFLGGFWLWRTVGPATVSSPADEQAAWATPTSPPRTFASSSPHAPEERRPSPTPRSPTRQFPTRSLPLFPDSNRYGILESRGLPLAFVFDRNAWRIVEHSSSRSMLVSRRLSSCHVYIEDMRDYVGPIWKVNIYGFDFSWMMLFYDPDEWHVYLWHLADSPVSNFRDGLAIGFFASGDEIEQCTNLALPVLSALQYTEENARNCRLIAQAPYQAGETLTTRSEVQVYRWPRWAMSAWMRSLPAGTTLRILDTPVCAATPHGPTLAWPVQWAGGEGWVLQDDLEGTLARPPAEVFPEGKPPVMWRKLCRAAPPSWLAVGVSGEVCTRKDRVRVRAQAGRQGAHIVWAWPGTRFRVIGGPECAEQWVWWQVRLDDGTTGWMAEGGDERDAKFLCPLAP